MKKKLWTTVLSLSFLLLFTAPLTAQDVPSGQEEVPMGQEEIPVGQEEGSIESETLFGEETGYLHPFLFFEARWTDNLYNTPYNEESDFITTISPGIWIALPANREKLLEIGTTSTSPGGLKLTRIKPQATRKAQAYFLYSPSIIHYAHNSQHDTVDHQLEGMLQYNANSGFSIDVVDQFNITHVEDNNGISERLIKYRDNLFQVIALYDPETRFKIRADYSNYDLDYEDEAYDYRDRNDNSISLYVHFKVQPKTSIFAEYEFSDIEYDFNTLSDSIENRYYLGVEWDITAKTKGLFKVGWLEKDFDDDAIPDDDMWSFEIQGQHNFSPTLALLLEGFRRYNETDFNESYYFETTGIRAALLKRFSEKWSATFEASFTNNQYIGLYTYDGQTAEREDDIFQLAPAIRYEFRDWLFFDLGYIYTDRDSNFDIFDYINNTIFFRADFSV